MNIRRVAALCATLLAVLALAGCRTDGSPPKPTGPPIVHQSDISGLPSDDTVNVCDLVRSNYLNDKLYTADTVAAVRIAAGRSHVNADVRAAIRSLYPGGEAPSSRADRDHGYNAVINACRGAGWK